MKKFTKIAKYFALFTLASAIIVSCGKQNAQDNSEEVKKMEQDFKKFADSIESVVAPAYQASSLAYFEASVNSNDSMWNIYTQKDMEVNKIYSNHETFAKLKKFKDSGMIKDSLLSRLLTVMYHDFLGKQIDTAKLNQLSKMQSAIENKYSKFRAKYNGKEYDDNQVEDVLKNSKNQKELQGVWEAHKMIGPTVADDIIALVKLRNEVARELGFKNYHEMSLTLSEENPEEVSQLFDELDNLTKGSFTEVKTEMDSILAARLHIKPSELMPWDYQNRYFQEAPKIYNLDVDKYFKDKKVVDLTADYYRGLGMPIDDIIQRSSLYPKENKNQHAYCINIDRKHDIRILGNVVNNDSWMETMLHEFGHALYENYYDNTLPWTLRQAAHIFVTEGIAMHFGRMALNPQWMEDMGIIDAKEKEKIAVECHKTLRLQQLVFSRWTQVMYRFEKSMYENPDQDLNKLWWDLVEKYQMLKRPEGRNMPDWATKIHIATSPCYYHNYLMGELFASQLYHTLTTKVLGDKEMSDQSFVGKKEVGDYIINNVFKVGDEYFWNDMIERATGEKLTPKYYAQQFVK